MASKPLTCPADRLRAATAGLLLVSALAALPRTANAEPTPREKETARSLVAEGDAKAHAKQYVEALKVYKAAHAIMGVPSTGIEVGRTQAALGQLVEAIDTLQTIMRYSKSPDEPQAFSKARTEAAALEEALVKRVPSVLIRVEGAPSGASVDVTIDGSVVPQAALTLPQKVNPGEHVITAKARSYKEATRTISLKEKESADVTLTLAPQPEVAPPPIAPAKSPMNSGSPRAAEQAALTPQQEKGRTTSPLVYIGFGVAGAGVVAGGVTGALSLSVVSDLSDRCPKDLCPPDAQKDIDKSILLANLSNIGFGVGVAGAALGLVGLFLPGTPSRAPASKEASPARVTPFIGLGGLGVNGVF